LSRNRVPITIRLTEVEYQGLQELVKFWGQDEKGILKLALAQLGQASFQIQEKLAAQKAAERKDDSCAIQPGLVSSES
jgi:hypothetical protein